jgi:hypothetical protein
MHYGIYRARDTAPASNGDSTWEEMSADDRSPKLNERQ